MTMLCGGPLAGREITLVARYLDVPFVVTEPALAGFRPWVGALKPFGSVIYDRGKYAGTFVRVRCCDSHEAHHTKRGAWRKRHKHEPSETSVQIPDLVSMPTRYIPTGFQEANGLRTWTAIPEAGR